MFSSRLINNLLAKLEAFFKIDLKYIIKGGSWISLELISANFFAFISAIVFANFLAPQIFGTYKYVLSIVALLYIFTLEEMRIAIIQAVTKGFEGSLIQGFKSKVRWGLLGGLASIGLALYYWIAGNNTLAFAFLIAFPFIPFIESFVISNTLFTGRKKFDLHAKFSITKNIISSLVILITVLITNNVLIILGAFFVIHTFVGFVLYQITIRKCQPNSNIDPQTINYGKHLSLMNAILTIASNLDSILIFHFVGAGGVAIYTFAKKPIIQLKFVNKIIKPLILPKFALRQEDKIKMAIFRQTFQFMILMAMFTVLYIILAPYFFKIFFPQYLESVYLSQIASILLISGALTIPQSALQAHSKTKQLYILNLTNALVNIILLYPLLMLWGILGIIVSQIIANFINLFLSLFLVRKYFK